MDRHLSFTRYSLLKKYFVEHLAQARIHTSLLRAGHQLTDIANNRFSKVTMDSANIHLWLLKLWYKSLMANRIVHSFKWSPYRIFINYKETFTLKGRNLVDTNWTKWSKLMSPIGQSDIICHLTWITEVHTHQLWSTPSPNALNTKPIPVHEETSENSKFQTSYGRWG